MKKLVVILAGAMVLAAPLAGLGEDRSGVANRGVVHDNLNRSLVTAASWNDAAAPRDTGHAFRFHLAPVALFSFDSDLNDITGSPIGGVEAGGGYWFAPQLGVGLSAQYFSTSNGTGEVDNVKFRDTDFTYLNVFFNVYSRLAAWNKVSLYGLAGLGYSNARLKGNAQYMMMLGDFDETDDGVAFEAGIGLEAPWVFTELRFSESSFSQGKNEEGENVVAVLDAVQVLIGMRTP